MSPSETLFIIYLLLIKKAFLSMVLTISGSKGLAIAVSAQYFILHDVIIGHP